ncbi:hypothetical protein GCM10008932_07060 [Alkalibacterium iburiense]|uniref:Uncharacterized protein n=1 Tax=Alkalibacterium iburiense TaxID=290589 RepID=A0ABP3GZC1_9LACT
MFIFGVGFIPQLGVTGVALSTAGVRFIIMIGLFIILHKRMTEPLTIKEFFSYEKEYASKILAIGVPSAGEILSYNVSQIVLTMMITTLGATALATRVYSQNLMSVLTVFSLSIAKGMQIYIGQLVGARKQTDAYHTLFVGLKYATIITIIIGSIFALFGRQIFGIFSNDPNLIQLGAMILVIELLLQPARTGNLVIISALRAAGDAVFPVMVGIAVMWGVLVPLAYVLGITLNLGLVGIWAAMLVDEWIRASLMFIRWKKKRWLGKSIAANKLS